MEGTLVLVAEDHPVNRTLLTRLLDRLGYASVTAQDGREALQKWRAGGFGAVVTDCNMPEMDGYDLARAIRAAEAKQGRPRMPIVACTANTVAGELQKCIEAGMDDLVAKPIELQSLATVMGNWLPLPAGGEGPPLSASSLAEVSGGDVLMEREILADFRAANDDDIDALRQALERRDLAHVVATSHRVKGACRTVGAVALADVCERIESAARRNNWQGVAAERDALEREFERLNAWLLEQATG
jgi:CheY-like chemotaxis protein